MRYLVNNKRLIETPPEECWDILMNLVEEVREDYLDSVVRRQRRPGIRIRDKLAYMRDMLQYMIIHSKVAKNLADNNEIVKHTQQMLDNSKKIRNDNKS